MTAELKPCPFCGVEASEFKDRGHSTAYSVGCFNCDCTIEANTWADTKAEAIAAWNTRADLSQAAIAAKNAQIIDLIEALRKRSNGEICGCGVDNPTDVCLSHYDVIEAVVRNRVQAAITAAMMGAYTEGWSDGAANCHHDRNETPDDGWLISDTYKSIPADAAAALEAVKTQVRDDTVRSAAIAAGNAIVAIAADADPDISPLRKQMLRVKMEKAVKAFTRDA
jgi:Lar family restriction alleviation protein